MFNLIRKISEILTALHVLSARRRTYGRRPRNGRPPRPVMFGNLHMEPSLLSSTPGKSREIRDPWEDENV